MWSGTFLLGQRVLEFVNLIILVVAVYTTTSTVLGITEKIQLQLRWMQFIHKSYSLCILRFNLFKCKNRWVLTHLQPCNHHHSQNKDVFITLKSPLVPFCSQFPPVSPASGNIDIISIPIILPFPECHILESYSVQFDCLPVS